MVWSTPRTYVVGEMITDSILNTHLRDQFNETGPAKVTTLGDLLVGSGANALKRLGKGTALQHLRVNAGATDLEYGPGGVDVFARVRHSASQPGVGNIALPYNTEVHDDFGCHDNVTNNHRLTVPTGKGGIYWVHASIQVSDDTAGQRTRLRIRNQGTTVIAGDSINTDVMADHLSLECEGLVDLDAAQWVDSAIDMNTGTETIDTVSPYTPIFEFMRVIPQE